MKHLYGLAVPVLMTLAVAIPACGGGDKQPAKAPTAATSGGAGVATPAPSNELRAELSGAAKDAYERGWKAYNAGDLSGAKAAFAEAAQKDPKSGAPRYALGTVLERLGDSAGAQSEYRAAYTAQPDLEVAMAAYALSLAHGGRGAEAEQFLADRRGKAPGSAVLATCLAEVKSLGKDSGAAQQLAQEALKLDPDHHDAMVVIARDHYRARRIELARYALQAILDGFGESTPPRNKGNAEASLVRGLLEREQGKRALAMNSFEAARAKRPDMTEALLNLGVMKLEAGNAAEALPLLESAARFSPNNALVHVNLGDAYRLMGRAAEAKKELDTALAQDSTLAVAHYNLGLLYLFTPQMPGVGEDQQVATAIKERETYKTMRGAKAAPGQTDDIDELISRAKSKQSELKVKQQAAAAASAAPAAPAPASSK